nr:hypothetical protein [Tanacetum cinerariifolium]
MPSSISSSRSYRESNTKDEIHRMTHYNCEIPIYQQVAWTPMNMGRRFKGCPIYDKKKKCGVYGFLDDELPLDYYKDLFYKIYIGNKEMNLKLKSLSNQDRGQKLIPNNASAEVLMEEIYKELNAFKVKAKVGSADLVSSYDCSFSPSSSKQCTFTPHRCYWSFLKPCCNFLSTHRGCCTLSKVFAAFLDLVAASLFVVSLVLAASSVLVPSVLAASFEVPTTLTPKTCDCCVPTMINMYSVKVCGCKIYI